MESLISVYLALMKLYDAHSFEIFFKSLMYCMPNLLRRQIHDNIFHVHPFAFNCVEHGFSRPQSSFHHSVLLGSTKPFSLVNFTKSEWRTKQKISKFKPHDVSCV